MSDACVYCEQGECMIGFPDQTSSDDQECVLNVGHPDCEHYESCDDHIDRTYFEVM